MTATPFNHCVRLVLSLKQLLIASLILLLKQRRSICWSLAIGIVVNLVVSRIPRLGFVDHREEEK